MADENPNTAYRERCERAFEKFGPLEASQLRCTAHGWLHADELILPFPAATARHILDALDALAIVHGTEVESDALDKLLDKMNCRG